MSIILRARVTLSQPVRSEQTTGTHANFVRVNGTIPLCKRCDKNRSKVEWNSIMHRGILRLIDCHWNGHPTSAAISQNRKKSSEIAKWHLGNPSVVFPKLYAEHLIDFVVTLPGKIQSGIHLCKLTVNAHTTRCAVCINAEAIAMGKDTDQCCAEYLGLYGRAEHSNETNTEQKYVCFTVHLFHWTFQQPPTNKKRSERFSVAIVWFRFICFPTELSSTLFLSFSLRLSFTH